MVRRGRGQTLALALVLLALGALLITPALNLASTVLKGRAVHHSKLTQQYASDAATEHAVRRLICEEDFAVYLFIGEESAPFSVTLNGIAVESTVMVQVSDSPAMDAPLTDDRYWITKDAGVPRCPDA